MGSFVGAARNVRYPTPRRNRAVDVPFEERERQHVARQLRRARLNNFIGTVTLMILFMCGAGALILVARLSADPNYIRPW